MEFILPNLIFGRSTQGTILTPKVKAITVFVLLIIHFFSIPVVNGYPTLYPSIQNRSRLDFLNDCDPENSTDVFYFLKNNLKLNSNLVYHLYHDEPIVFIKDEYLNQSKGFEIFDYPSYQRSKLRIERGSSQNNLYFTWQELDPEYDHKYIMELKFGNDNFYCGFTLKRLQSIELDILQSQGNPSNMYFTLSFFNILFLVVIFGIGVDLLLYLSSPKIRTKN